MDTVECWFLYLHLICGYFQGIKACENKTFAHVKDLKEAIESQAGATTKAIDEVLCAQTEEISLRFKTQAYLQRAERHERHVHVT